MGSQIVLEDYLVRLGFDLNSTGLNQFLELVGKGKRKIESIFPAVNNNLTKSSFAVAGLFATAAVGTMKLIEAVASADIKMEVFARKMWMNEEAARGMSTAAEALGYSLEDLSSIALSPELTAQFKELYNLTNRLQAPAELQEQLKLVRSITFEWKKFGLMAKYAVYWVTYYLNKYLHKDLLKVKQMLENINKWIESNLPNIASKIAIVLSSMFKIIESVGKSVSFVFNMLEKITGLTSGELLAQIALIGAAIVIAVFPVATISATIIAILLLIDDLITYLEGGNSEFEKMWNFVSKIFKAVAYGINYFIDGIKILYYYVRLIAAGIKDAANFDFSFPSIAEWQDKINGIKSEYGVNAIVQSSSSSNASRGGKANNEYNQNVYVYSNDSKSAGAEVAKQSSLAINRGLRKDY